MKETPITKESIVLREQQERLAVAAGTSEVLTKLNISIDKLPQKCKQLLNQACTTQVSLGLDGIDPLMISLQLTAEMAKELDNESEMLTLRHKNEELQAKINRNKNFLDQFRKDWAESRESLSKQTPNPDNINEYCKQMRQKLTSYEESYEKAKERFSKLSVPDNLMPSEMAAHMTFYEELTEKVVMLRRQAQDVELEKNAREALRLTHGMC